MKIRIRFAKEGVMKYVGHLDMMRYFQKAMRRAEIPIKYSEGYNPHQIMSFAAPLGVGITSRGEYLDIEVTEDITSKDTMNALNATMVEGMKILEVKELPDTVKNAMSSLAGASYHLTYKNGYQIPLTVDEALQKKQQFFDEADNIIIIKKTKKSERELDLKPLVYQFDVVAGKDGQPEYDLFVSTGSVDNIKPELVIKHFHEYLGVEDAGKNIAVHRNDMYTRIEDQFVSLGAVGHER